MSKSTFQVPFEPDGSIPHYADEWRLGKPVVYDWRDPVPFEATLTLVTHTRGRSAAYFIVRSDTGARYVAFITDIFDMVRDPRWVAGKITATFVPCKRGANYGVRLVMPKCARKACSRDGMWPHRDLPGLYCGPCGIKINDVNHERLVLLPEGA